MAADLIGRYADVVVRVGVNVREGQDVYVRGDVAHAPLARAIVEAAYRAGAARVMVDYADAHVQHSTLTHASVETLSSAPDWVLERVRSWARDEVGLVSLTGHPEPGLMNDVDPEKAAAVPRELAQLSRSALLGGDVAWTIVAAPNPGWATQIFGEPDMDRLWEAVRVAMRLDEPDAVAAWQEHRDRLIARAERITAMELDAVRYHGEGTDLTIGLIPGSHWTGGQLVTRSGRVHMPNLPTEEVFTSPDRRRADGTMTLTRPLAMPRTGVLVEGLQVTFEAGRIVQAKAGRGEEAILAQLDTDEGARSLGEVALLDRSSRIDKAGVIFHDTLYDENAGCHVAWGQSFPFVLDGGTSMAPDALFDRGLNTSAVHTDVVIGGPGVSIDGIKLDGTVVPLIVDNEWALPG